MARISTAALPVDFALSIMAEVCLPPLWAMPTPPAPRTQWIYVDIKQLVVCCSQIPFKSRNSQKSQILSYHWHKPESHLLIKSCFCLWSANSLSGEKIGSYKECVLESHFYGSRSPLLFFLSFCRTYADPCSTLGAICNQRLHVYFLAVK